MSDGVKRKCPECGELKLRRLVGTGAGVIFKGSGFYETDYRGDSYKKAADADKKKPDEKKPDEKKASDKSEAKAETKKDGAAKTKDDKTPSSSKKKPSSSD